MDQCKVTVAVVTFDTPGHLLDRCLKSVAQQLPADEVIVVDDGSNSPVTLSDTTLRLIRHDHNQGVMKSRRQAIDAANGKYFMFVDADDYISPHAIERAYTQAEETDADLVQMRVVNRVTAWNLPLPASNCYDTDLASFAAVCDDRAFPIQCWGKLYRTSLLQTCPIPFYDGFWGEDRLINLAFYSLMPKVAVCKKAVYNYCWHRSPTKKASRSRLDEYAEVHRLKKEMPCTLPYKNEMDGYLISLLEYDIRQQINAGTYSEEGLKATLSKEPWRSLNLPDMIEYANRMMHSKKRIIKKFLKRFL